MQRNMLNGMKYACYDLIDMNNNINRIAFLILLLLDSCSGSVFCGNLRIQLPTKMPENRETLEFLKRVKERESQMIWLTVDQPTDRSEISVICMR